MTAAEPGRPSSRRTPRFPGLPRPPARTLAVMHSWQPATYSLEPPGTFAPDPDCSHCTHDPGYQHRHWTRKHPVPGPPAEWQPNWAWRLAFRVWGDG